MQTGVIRLRLRPMRSQTRAETTIAWASGNVSVTLRTRIRELVPWDFDGDFDPHRTSLDAPRMVPAPSGILLRRQEKEMKVHVASPEKRTLDFTITNVGLLLMLTAVAAAAIVLGPFSTAPLRAQQSQLTGTGVLDGDWQNVDPNTRGIVEIVIAGRKVHPFGACHPSACDQGVIKAKGFASSVDSSDIRRLVAKERTGFSQVEITLSLEPDGRLRADRFTHFTDGSGRADYSAVDYFKRGRRPYVP